MDQLIQLAMICDVLGDSPTEAQEYGLVDWIIEHAPSAEWSGILDSLSHYDTAYTELSKRIGENNA